MAAADLYLTIMFLNSFQTCSSFSESYISFLWCVWVLVWVCVCMCAIDRAMIAPMQCSAALQYYRHAQMDRQREKREKEKERKDKEKEQTRESIFKHIQTYSSISKQIHKFPKAKRKREIKKERYRKKHRVLIHIPVRSIIFKHIQTLPNIFKYIKATS